MSKTVSYLPSAWESSTWGEDFESNSLATEQPVTGNSDGIINHRFKYVQIMFGFHYKRAINQKMCGQSMPAITLSDGDLSEC